MRCWVRLGGLAAGLAIMAAHVEAADPVVQVIDGWKIIIQPGERTYPRSTGSVATAGPIITPARFAAALNEARPALNPPGPIDEGIPPTPEGVAPPAPSAQFLRPASPTEQYDDGLPIIAPGESTSCCDSQPIVSPPEGTVDPRYLSQMYVDIYKSIPFIRAEYNANPSYIHDTAVEFLFGKMRPTVIHRETVNVNNNSPYSYGYGYPIGYGSSYGYGGYGFGGYPNGLAYPPIQLVVPGTGLRIHRLN